MAPRGFDRFMVAVEIASSLKVGRLTDREFRCLVTGVWPIAAKANPRGYLVVAGDRATEHDVARQASLPVSTARSTLSKMRDLGMLDEGENGFEYCHDWHEMNPGPKKDETANDRKRRQRLRERAERDSHGDVTP